MKNREPRYIPALTKKWLTPIYDPLLKWGMHENTFKQYLVENMNLQNGQQVLDLGCGTGTLTILIKQHQPSIKVFGLDGDPQILEIAKSKSNALHLDIQWDKGMAYAMPYQASFFDRIVSCLVIHHLTAINKLKAFQEVYRVLKADGEFHLLDFGKPRNLLMRMISIPISHMEEAGDNVRGLIPEMLKDAGFKNLKDTAHFYTIFGELVYYQVFKSG